MYAELIISVDYMFVYCSATRLWPVPGKQPGVCQVKTLAKIFKKKLYLSFPFFACVPNMV